MSLKSNVERVYGKPIREILIDFYIKQDMNIYELADELNIALGTAFNWLKEYGVAKVKLEQKEKPKW